MILVIIIIMMAILVAIATAVVVKESVPSQKDRSDGLDTKKEYERIGLLS